MATTTALFSDRNEDTMTMVDDPNSHTPVSESLSNTELIEVGRCKIVLEFAKTPNPAIRRTIAEMLIESHEKRSKNQ